MIYNTIKISSPTFLNSIIQLVFMVEMQFVFCEDENKLLFTELQLSHKVTTTLSSSDQFS
jgi:hypothetical protein